MHLLRVVLAACIANLALADGASAQWSRNPQCDRPGGDYLACALQGGGVKDLRDLELGPGEREVRFWTVSGMFMPDQVLVIHQRGDSVTGRLLLIWNQDSEAGALATSTCAERWYMAIASICAGYFRDTRDWSATLRQLDALALWQTPSSPVGEQPCDRTPIPARPGELPRDRLCAAMADGFSYTLEVRTTTLYWRYTFPRIPDTTATGAKRDAAILQVLTCAARKRGDGGC